MQPATMPGAMTSEQNDQAGHIPVLSAQVMALLAPRSGQVCVDCTVGRGGHAALILPRLAPGGRFVGIDRDPHNIAFCRRQLQRSAPDDVEWDLVPASFADLSHVLADLKLDGADLLLADLGFSSNQMDDPQRGFSFGTSGPLDMRYDPTGPTTAEDLVNTLDERSLANLIYENGQERFSRRIAAKIIEHRRQAPIKDTMVLAQIVRSAYGSIASRSRGRRRPRRIDPSTRTFMALRVAVNQELDCLRALLEQLPKVLRRGAVAGIISFHSLEDRLVKSAFRELGRSGLGELLTRRPMTADDAERQANRRSRSAKLRAIRFDSGPTAAAMS